MTTTKDPRSRLAEIPAEPLRRHIRRWMNGFGFDPQDGCEGLMSPARIMVEKAWPEQVESAGWEGAERNFRRIMYTQDAVSFDLADRIICQAIGDPEIWISDPELREAYLKCDLRSLDAAKPTCDEVAERIADDVVEAYRGVGTINGTMRATGLAYGRVRAILEGRGLLGTPRELACA